MELMWSVIAQRKVGVGSRRRGLPAAGASEPSAELTLRTFNREVSDIFVYPAFGRHNFICGILGPPAARLHLTILKGKISDI